MIGTIVSALSSIFGSLLANRRLREENLHEETLAAAEVAATVERAMGRGQGWFGRAVDAYTRLMRPLILTSSIAGIVWIVHLSYTDPVGATRLFEALAMAEDVLLMLLVFPLAHFGIRPFEKQSIFRKTADFALRRAQANTIETLIDQGAIDRQLLAELDDTTKPLSNWAVAEINRRMREGKPIRPGG